MSAETETLPPHYHALRVLWTVTQVALLAVLVAVLLGAFPPGELIGDVRDWADDLLF